MGVPPVTRLLLVSVDGAVRERVIETVDHCPDIELTVVETPEDARSHLAATRADCILVDAATAGQPLVEFREQLRIDYPTLPVIVAAETTRTLPASLSVHGVVETADPAALAELVRVLTTTKRRSRSPAVSVEHG